MVLPQHRAPMAHCSRAVLYLAAGSRYRRVLIKQATRAVQAMAELIWVFLNSVPMARAGYMQPTLAPKATIIRIVLLVMRRATWWLWAEPIARATRAHCLGRAVAPIFVLPN